MPRNSADATTPTGSHSNASRMNTVRGTQSPPNDLPAKPQALMPNANGATAPASIDSRGRPAAGSLQLPYGTGPSSGRAPRLPAGDA